MSQIGMIIEERSRDIGDFLVGRLLPFRKKRMVGPFIYLDHMGPVTLPPGERFDIEPHPHIGLSTLTYLFEGEIVHRDSIGTTQEIRAGAVNWMSAGKGVVHSERSTPETDNQEKHMHGLQIWVALPKEKEDMEPVFHHTPASELPSWEEGSLKYKLVAGKAYGRQSPVPVHSTLFMVEIKSDQKQSFELDKSCVGERALYILKGSITACGERLEAGQLLVTKEEASCAFEIGEDSHIVLFGGDPYPEERHIYWNFVSTDKDKIEQAKERWNKHEFPSVPNDDGYVPLPRTK
jgi:redox-sensitive bicupin YhaK (pirin superfamily)